MQLTTNFSLEELARASSKGFDESRVHMPSVKRLQKLRDLCGLPIFITSYWRSPEHNAAVGGAKNSAHLTGHAFDIRIPDSWYRFKIVQAALRVGFHRIGIGKDFIHLDDSKLPSPVIWTY